MSTILEQRQAVATESLTWAGTPFRPHAAIKGAGITCSSLISASFNAALGTALVIPEFDEQWYVNREDDFYLTELHKAGFIEITKASSQLADLVLSRTKYRVYCHAAILIEVSKWPKRTAGIMHATTRGAEKIPSIYASWHFSMQPHTFKYFSWGGWH
jgi:cell wall-associated NlpC family hydrolase